MRSVRLTDSSPTGAASSRPDRPPPVETPRETSRPERLRETCQPRRRRRRPRIGGEPRERSRPVGSQRPALQRVAYLLENGTLRREYWNVLDPTLASTTYPRDLMTHVKALTVRYLDQAHQWQTLWPATALRQEQVLRQRPLAVEITLDTEDWGKIVRVIEIPG